MANNSKRKLLFTTLFLTILIVSSGYAALIPNAHAAPVTPLQKGEAISKDVVGLDLTKYAKTTRNCRKTRT